MSGKTLDEHIERTPDTAGGRPRIGGRRITVQQIAYYFDHREEIDARMAEDRAFAEALRAGTSRFLASLKADSVAGERCR